MLKHNTFIYLASVLTVIYFVYHFENAVNKINEDIKIKTAKISNIENDLRVFEAEWSHQNNPDRLSRMYEKVNLKQMQSPKKIQYTNIKDIRDRDVMFAQKDE